MYETHLKLSSYVQENYFPLAATVMNWNNNRHNTVNPFHTHNFSEVVIIAKGSITHHINNETWSLFAGDFFVVHPGYGHAYSDMTPETVVYNIIYNSQIALPMLLLTKSPFLRLLYPDRNEAAKLSPHILGTVPKTDLARITTLHRYLLMEQKKQRPRFQTSMVSLFTAVIVQLSYFCKEENTSPKEWSLSKTIAEMNNRLNDSDFSISSLALESGMSPRTMERYFKSVFGISPAGYFQQLRISRAVSLLQTTQLSGESIASQCGFYSYSHMWTMFRKHLKCIPSDIRSGRVRDFNLQLKPLKS